MSVFYKINSYMCDVSNKRFGELIRNGIIKPGDIDFCRIKKDKPKLGDEMTLDEKRDMENDRAVTEIYPKPAMA